MFWFWGYLTKAQASLQGAIDSLLRGWWGPVGTAKEKDSVDSLLPSLFTSGPSSPPTPPPPPPRPGWGDGGARVRRRAPGMGSTWSRNEGGLRLRKGSRTWVVTVSLLWTDAEENCEEEGREEEDNSGPDSRWTAHSWELWVENRFHFHCSKRCFFANTIYKYIKWTSVVRNLLIRTIKKTWWSVFTLPTIICWWSFVPSAGHGERGGWKSESTKDHQMVSVGERGWRKREDKGHLSSKRALAPSSRFFGWEKNIEFTSNWISSNFIWIASLEGNLIWDSGRPRLNPNPVSAPIIRNHPPGHKVLLG